MVLVFFLVRLPRPATSQQPSIRDVVLQLDFPGLFVAVASLVCLTLALEWGGTARPWSDGSVIACLVVCVFLTGVFVAIQIWQGERAMIPLYIITNRVIWINCLYVFL